ncbi:hypothetical protein, unlikely [Trypanosoma brucei gambiense DAL972]|uniref:Uncharacterized protein n=1 Tax=Trypanosoma brucei gambiense (strain MHOM/CI/86/DAL972) TaxID=679716 RepID=D0A8I2_TRYB9|nr:hypothetical protein, unlikely [Trypanosoma brucei gambiense DAL972]CBH17983.1 hypothetical protein, unlikely [Trypanosoma brucei gambiense DAL972]|eukprot:XP_011780247.1 hypothetical protein, unlikely [Trypanosoma brucei gambiense DAL972]
MEFSKFWFRRAITSLLDWLFSCFVDFCFPSSLCFRLFSSRFCTFTLLRLLASLLVGSLLPPPCNGVLHKAGTSPQYFFAAFASGGARRAPPLGRSAALAHAQHLLSSELKTLPPLASLLFPSIFLWPFLQALPASCIYDLVFPFARQHFLASFCRFATSHIQRCGNSPFTPFRIAFSLLHLQ